MSQESIICFMDNTIFLTEEERKKLLDVFIDLKDKYAPNSADSAFILKDIVDAIENNTLTFEHLKRLHTCDNYTHIMNMLRTARFNLDITRFSENN